MNRRSLLTMSFLMCILCLPFAFAQDSLNISRTAVLSLSLNQPLKVVTSGNFAYVGTDFGVVIFNVATPTAPVRVGQLNLTHRATGIAASGNYLYVSEYNAGLRIFNIFNPATPIATSFF